jgi:lambda family phage tail tape measure protein
MADVSLGKVSLEADTSSLDQLKEKLTDLKDGVPSTGALIDKFVDSLKEIPGPVGVAVVGLAALGAAMVELVSSSMEAQEQLLSQAEAMGMSVEAAQQLQLAMKLGGVSTEQLTGMTSRLSKALGEAAADPFSKASIALQKFGVTQEQIKSGDISSVLQTIGANLGKFSNDANLSAITMQLFGRNGAQAKEALADLAENTAKAQQAIADYGIAVTTADAEGSKNFLKTLSLSSTMFQKVGLDITRALTPALQELVNQFAESGKAGGAMRAIIDAVSGTLTVLAKVILTVLYVPITAVVEAFKLAGTAIGAFGAAIGQLAQGNIKGAGAIMSQMVTDMKNIDVAADQATQAFLSKTWGAPVAPLEATDAAAKKATVSIGTLKDNSKYLLELQQNLQDAVRSYTASTVSIDAYNEALQKQKIAQDLLKQNIDPNSSDGQKAAAEIAATTQLNQLTKEEVDGKTKLRELQQQLAASTNQQTEAEKIYFETTQGGLKDIQEADKQALMAAAQEIDQRKQATEVAKASAVMTQQAAQYQDKYADSMTLTAQQLQYVQAQLKLFDQYQKDIKQYPNDVDQLTQSYTKAATQIATTNQQVTQFQQSIQGGMAGAQQAFNTFAQSAQNLNTTFNQLTTQSLNGFSSAIVSAMNGGKDAFQKFALMAVQQIETIIVKMLLLKAIQSSTTFLASGGTTGGGAAGTSSNPNAYFARGGINWAASGIVTSATMVAPNTIAGEQGNSTGEAVMPLIRTSDGSLGVNTGGGSGAGTSVGAINHVYQINVNAQGNQNPQQVAQAVQNQIKQIQNVANMQIANNLRPGGMLNPVTVNAF